MEGIELVSFEIISNVGAAKSCFIEALQNVKANKVEEANKLIEEGNRLLLNAHKTHSTLIQQEASGEKVEINLLLMHAEDQLMSTETIKFLIVELIEIHINK